MRPSPWVGDPAAIRSALFTPGDRPERFAKAGLAGADAAILDLEDGVAPAARPGARETIGRYLAERDAGAGVCAVRINPPGSRDASLDIASLCALPRPLDLLVVPKVATPADLDGIAAAWEGGEPPEVVAFIESAAAVEVAPRIARHPLTAALAVGSADLAADLGADGGWESLLFCRSRVVQACALARVVAWDAPCFALDDAAALTDESRRARALGFTGKLAIHPRQVPVINDAFTPSADEVAQAQQWLDAVGPTGGAVSVDGVMVDEALLRRARQTIARAGLPSRRL